MRKFLCLWWLWWLWCLPSCQPPTDHPRTYRASYYTQECTFVGWATEKHGLAERLVMIEFRAVVTDGDCLIYARNRSYEPVMIRVPDSPRDPQTGNYGPLPARRLGEPGYELRISRERLLGRDAALATVEVEIFVNENELVGTKLVYCWTPVSK